MDPASDIGKENRTFKGIRDYGDQETRLLHGAPNEQPVND